MAVFLLHGDMWWIGPLIWLVLVPTAVVLGIWLDRWWKAWRARKQLK